MPVRRFTAATIALIATAGACGGDAEEPIRDTARPAAVNPDEPPAMLNRQAPFRYPTPLFARRVQGNVTLRLYVDSTGRVRPESTRVHESSGSPALDSAAVRGAGELTFSPAKHAGVPIGTVVIFPVHFRHPDAEPLRGDSAATKGRSG